MRFGLDLQTETDLNIFPQKMGDVSVLGFYDRTVTRGGSDALEHLMRTPTDDLDEIDYRVSAIKFIHGNRCCFKLDRKKLYAIEVYLDLNTPILRDNFIVSFAHWINNQVQVSNEYNLIAKGVEFLRDHLLNLSNIVDSLEESDLPPFFIQLKEEVKAVKYTPELKAFLKPNPMKVTFRQVSRLDRIVRKKEKERISNLLKLTYLLDAFASVAETARNKGLSFAEICESPKPLIRIEGLFHPLLEEPVPNNIELNENSNLCFVSGANMAGKSTFLKTVGLCIFLAHIGFPVPARAMETSAFSGLYTTINISDSIYKGYSHYYSEVRRVKDIALMIKEQKKVFVIFDELFRGTNVKDAFDATLLITSKFAEIKSSLFFISTHIVEVCQELEKLKNITFKQLESKLEGEVPVYSYRLKDGISSERIGLTIVKNEKILEIIEEIVQRES